MRRLIGTFPRAASVLALLAVIALTASAAVAQKQAIDAKRIAAARELLDLTGAAKNFETIMPAMMEQISRLLITQKPDKRAEIEQVTQAVLGKLLSRRQELIDQIAVIYAARLTDDDIAGITTFFKSPVGRRYIAQQPELMKESMAAGQAWGQRLGAEIDSTMRQELKKRGIDL